MSVLTRHTHKTCRFQVGNILLKFFFNQRCLSKFAMNLFLPMIRTVLDVRAQKPWADVSPEEDVSRLKEMNPALAWGRGTEVMLRTKDSDSIIHIPSDYILNIKVELGSRSDT